MIATFISRAMTSSKGALFTLIACALMSTSAFAAQTGSITGIVTDQAGGNGLSDVAIEATSNVLPQPRRITTATNGRYKFAVLPPGQYKVVFSGSGQKTTRNVLVTLNRTSEVDVVLSAAAEMESVTVLGESTSANLATASLKTSIGAEMIDKLAVGQDYRDLIKLIPGVQYTEDGTRGPSAGGSGQDNVYQFDGVDVSTPLFGTLSAEPSTHDIEQVSVVKGGAAAVGFNRSGGFTINTISKSGTDEWKGEVSYKIQPEGLTVKRKSSDLKEFDESKVWLTASAGGPLIEDRLYVYGSYYAPTVSRDNSATAYGPVGDYDSDRDEYFGKLTYSVTEDILLKLSHRSSDREVENESVSQFAHPSTSEGSEIDKVITIFEGSWIATDETTVSFKFTDSEENSSTRPDNIFSVAPAINSNLDIANLDKQGLLLVPKLKTGEAAYNAFVQPLINSYGYDSNGSKLGGGEVGGDSQIDDVQFYRESFELSVDHTFYWGDVTHDLHFGYKWEEAGEKLARLSNGWGVISVPGGLSKANNGADIFYEARVQQMSLVGANGATIPEIDSSFETNMFEVNDTIIWGDFTFNVGFLVSQDEMFGEGLAKNSANPSGFEVAVGNKYSMHKLDYKDMFQPRLGFTWDMNDTTSLFTNYAIYNPAASSLPRAASWARNLRKDIKVRFDQAGNFIESDAVRSSSGKIFQDDLDPRRIMEFIVGLNHEFENGAMGTFHIRHRKADRFWEDTPNTSRSQADAPEHLKNKGLYVPNLEVFRKGVLLDGVGGIGGSSYVVAQLDDAENKFWEASFELDWNITEDWFMRGSYVWSHYYGNFDQDSSTNNNDQNIFVGSSNIADGAGRQLWNNRQGDLRGDRRHQFKLFTYYALPWEANVGASVIAQSGQPWEKWDHTPYKSLTGSTSDTTRYAESAGSRTSSSHWQVDLNYTQNFAIWQEMNLQLRADLFNVFDKQTGYDIEPRVNRAGFGAPRDAFNPRRLQLAVKVQF